MADIAFRHGSRVKYVKDKIEDVPKGTVGTVVGDPSSVIIVRFDGIECNRYMRKSDLRIVSSAGGNG